jgi:hypothetical protein
VAIRTTSDHLPPLPAGAQTLFIRRPALTPVLECLGLAILSAIDSASDDDNVRAKLCDDFAWSVVLLALAVSASRFLHAGSHSNEIVAPLRVHALLGDESHDKIAVEAGMRGASVGVFWEEEIVFA